LQALRSQFWRPVAPVEDPGRCRGRCPGLPFGRPSAAVPVIKSGIGT